MFRWHTFAQHKKGSFQKKTDTNLINGFMQVHNQSMKYFTKIEYTNDH